MYFELNIAGSLFRKEVLFKSLKFTAINLDRYCSDQDIEACVIELDPTYVNISMLAIYRSPVGKINNFITQLDIILQTIHNPRWDLIYGYINVNYLNDNDRKSQLDAVLNSYSLCSTGNFPTRINSDSSSVIDNIFIDISKTDDYETITIMNGLSDYDAQFIILNNSEQAIWVSVLF